MAQVTAPRQSVTITPPKRSITRQMRNEWTAYAMQLPGLLLFAVFTVYSVAAAAYLSFTNYDPVARSGDFVGWANYRAVLHDGTWWAAMGHTLYFTVGTMIPSMVIGLGLASLLNSKIRGLSFYRTAFYLPAITPLVIATLLWKWLYNGDYGLFNYYLLRLHIIHTPIQFLADARWAMPSVILMQIWLSIGFNMVVYLAGLQAIPAELYEAAEVDGATAWQRMRRITIPMLWPTTIFLLVFQTILGMQTFDQIFVMTSGGPPGPGGATTTVTYYIYLNAFQYLKMGKASALAWTLFLVVFVLSLTQFRWYVKQVER
jgi:multiple sugar transport system permease protein